MIPNRYEIRAKVWLYSGHAAWHFVTLPKDVSAQIKALFGMAGRGWGSLPVIVTVGSTRWKTSIFPDKKAGAYLLPIKTEVRKKEGIREGDVMRFTLEVQV